MGTEGKPKISPLKAYWDAMSPEEKQAKKAEILAKSFEVKRQNRERKKQEAEELQRKAEEVRRKAEELAPRLLAEELLMIEEENYIPRKETLRKMRALLDNPSMTFEELKRKHFSSMSEKAWSKLTKFLFSEQLSNVEDLGNDILQEKRLAIKSLERRIRMLRKEVKMSREINLAKFLGKKTEEDFPKKVLKKYKVANPKLLEMLGDAEKELREFKLDVQRTLHDVKFANERKSGAVALHVHTQVPRPAPKDVTPAKVSLSQVLAADGN